MFKLISGASLIEILVAMALGLWLIMGILLCYLSQQRTFRVNQALARIQENARATINLLQQDINMAGYVGCLPLSSLLLQQIPGETAFDAHTRLIGWHQLASSADFVLPTDIEKLALPESDILLTQAMQPDNFSIVNAQADFIITQQKTDYDIGDILLIADCTHANIVKVISINNKNITIEPALLRPYDHTAQIGHLATIFYYIRKTARQNESKKSIYALYRRDINKPSRQPQEVVEGIDNLQIKFGIKKNGVLQYLPAAALNKQDWQYIIGLHIALLFNSIDRISDRTTTYFYQQKEYSNQDQLLRKEWDVTLTTREPNLAF